MTTLHIELPDSHSNPPANSEHFSVHHVLCGKGAKLLTMQADGQMTIDTTEATMTAVLGTMIHDTDHSLVYRAQLDDGRAVVIKFSVDNDSVADLNTEANAYHTLLAPLQGSVIPMFYGKYHGTCPHGRKLSCIVLEDCGKSLEKELDELSKDDKIKIIEQLGKLHHHSRLHANDFAERNIVVTKDDQYRLIDFHSLVEHECTFDGVWGFGEYCRNNFGCPILRRIGLELQLWKSYLPQGTVTVYGYQYPIAWYPSQNVVDQLIGEDECLQERWNESPAQEWLQDVRINAAGMDLEDEEAIMNYARSIKPHFSKDFPEYDE